MGVRVRTVKRHLSGLRSRRRVEPPVCHDLESWAASCDGAAYSVIDRAFTTTRPLPKTIEPTVHESFPPLCSYPVPERALVSIPNGRIRGSFGLVILPGGEFAGQLLAMTPEGQDTMLRAQPAYVESLPRRPIRKKGSYYAVLGLGVQHYYHWSHDIIMRMRGLADRLPPDTQLIVPERMKPFQVETLGLLGLDDHPRLPFPAVECWELETLHVITPTLKTQIDSNEPYQWFRAAAMARYGVRDGLPTRRLYLTRRHDQHWRTVNEDEVDRLLSRYGFETVAPGTMSFREQIELFAEAEIIVGTGAGLMNMIFAPAGATVIQLQERSHVVHALWTMAGAVGVDYHYFFCDVVPNPGGANVDLHVPTDKLETSLASLADPLAPVTP